MKLLFLLSLLFSVTGNCKTYDTESVCKSRPGELIESKKEKDCFFKILCNASRVDLYLVCGKGKEFYSFGFDKLLPDERIISVSYLYPRLLFTTIIKTETKIEGRLLQGLPLEDKLVVLKEESKTFFKFLKTEGGDILYKFEGVSCSKTKYDLKYQGKCFKKSEQPASSYFR